METKQQNSDWEDKPQVKKGNIGEDIIRKYLENKGWIVYEPVTNSAHLSDKFAVKDKKEIIIAEQKTKAKLNKFDGTGFNYKNYLEYKKISKKYNLPIFIFFVDEMLKKIYGNFLSELEKPCIFKGKLHPEGMRYPLTIRQGEIIIFPMCHMKGIKKLTEGEIKEIKKHNTRNYLYSN